MAQQIPVSPEFAFDPTADDSRADEVHELTADVAYKRLAIVNVVFLGPPAAGDRGWVLVDAGIFGSASFIRSAAEKRFGKGARPAAIILTHAHFDHVGVLETLASDWDVPVYSHPLERPYLTGEASYPPPDPSVGGGMMSLLSPLYPRSPPSRMTPACQRCQAGPGSTLQGMRPATSPSGASAIAC